jgi:hypothetical protein
MKSATAILKYRSASDALFQVLPRMPRAQLGHRNALPIAACAGYKDCPVQAPNSGHSHFMVIYLAATILSGRSMGSSISEIAVLSLKGQCHES